jgi:hypothetical protein
MSTRHLDSLKYDNLGMAGAQLLMSCIISALLALMIFQEAT